MSISNMWLIIELNENCRLEDQVDQVISEIRAAFGDTEYFIPVKMEKVKEKRIFKVLFDGYVFVNCSSEQSAKEGVHSLYGTYLQKPLSFKSKLQFIKDADIERFKKELDISVEETYPVVGDIIIPKQGTFRDMEGEVLKIDRVNKSVEAIFKTLSREVTTKISVLNITTKRCK